MAAVAATRTMLVRLRFSNEAAASVTDASGIADTDDFRHMDDDQCNRLCRSLTKPGGAIVNPCF